MTLLSADGNGAGVNDPVHSQQTRRLEAVVHAKNVQLHVQVGVGLPATQQVGQVYHAIGLGHGNRVNHVLELGNITANNPDMVFHSGK